MELDLRRASARRPGALAPGEKDINGITSTLPFT